MDCARAAPLALVRDVGLGVAGALAATPPVYALFFLLTRWFVSSHPLVEMVNKEHGLVTFAMSVLSAVIVAPLFEEFVFRVVLQGWLEKVEDERSTLPTTRRRLPAGLMPVAVASLVFALFHFSHGPDPVPLFFLSLVLGYLYRQTHRLWPSLAMHATFNATTLCWLWLSLE